MVWTKMFVKTTLVSALAAGFLLLGGVTTAHADRDDCNRNVQRWEYKLNQDVNRHGFDSRQANRDRHELAVARERCEHQSGNNRRDHNDYNRDYR